MTGTVRVGCSGWSYRGWRGDFYPAGLRQRDELAFLAERTTAVEVNGSFYALQRPSSYVAWRDATPEGYRICVKGGRYLTHLKRLRDPRQALANFLASGVLALGDRTGPVLWQLPADLALDEALVGAFLALLPRTTGEAAQLAREHDAKVPGDRALTTVEEDRPLQHVLEPRHPSFGTPEAADLLRTHAVGLVVSDGAGRWPMFEAVTSDVVYVRLHGDTELYASRYDDEALDRWARRCGAWAEDDREVYVFLDNDARGHAPHDAVRLLARLSGVSGGVVAGRT
jgi:uncharacterized protein YecE (DUF72 family)